MSKKNIAKLKRKADKLWSIKVREVGKCELCSSVDHLNAHHIITRRFSLLRWDLKNSICLCCVCHKFGLSSVHNCPLTVMDWLKENPQIEAYLRMMSQQPIKKYTVEDMENIIIGLTK